jgi:glutamyl-tRNA(Gln) amidotransferase subunit D
MNSGDRVRVTRGQHTHEGIVLPSSTPEHLVLKLSGGYNIGINREAAQVDVIESGAHEIESAQMETETSRISFDDSLPTVSLISTGGTIASTVDYRTGAVTAQFDAEDVLRAVPDLAGRANYRGNVVANILSENMTPSVWQDLAETVATEISAGVDGVVIMHGTDTMQYTAAALSFMIETPVPVVFTGSQRSADRPSSDNVMNAVCAVEAAKTETAEVLVCMHDSMADDACALHRGTRVRKNHTSRRDAFETLGADPIGYVNYADESVNFNRPVSRQEGKELAVHPELDERVSLIKFTPGMSVSHYETMLADLNPAGLIIEGTGLGHVNTEFIPLIDSLVDEGVIVGMTSQCLSGRVCDRVYDTGRDLLDAGVIELEDMLPETAVVKLMWALENTQDPEAQLSEPMTQEIQPRSVPWT